VLCRPTDLYVTRVLNGTFSVLHTQATNVHVLVTAACEHTASPMLSLFTDVEY